MLKTLSQRFLILFLLLGLILVPRLAAGILDLRQANHLDLAGDYAAAAALYASAAGRLPWQPFLWEKAGAAAMNAGDPQGTIKFLNQAAARNALSQGGWLSLGKAYRQAGNLPSAVNAWKHALPLAEAYRSLAEDERKVGDFSAALDGWRASLLQQPGDASAHYQLGLLLMTAAPQEALPELMQAAKLDPALDASVQDMRAALNAGLLSDDRAYQLLISGRALGAAGDWDLAAEAFHNAVAARPDYADAWGWLSEAKQQQGQDGSTEMERALAINPNSALLQSLYGLYLERQKQPKKALEAFQKAVALEPGDPGWEMALAGAYEQTGDLVAALEHYQHAVALSPGQATAWQALAEFSLRNSADLVGTGLPAVRRLVELSKDDWQADDLAGQILLETGDAVGAEVLLKKASELAPTQAAPYLHLGVLYLQMGDHPAANAKLRQAMLFDPNGPYGWQAKRLLEQYFP